MTRELQRDLLDELAAANAAHLAERGGNADLAARIASYELAFKMQQHAPEAVDLAGETAGHARAVRHRRRAHRRIRPPLPAGPAAGRTRRPLRADLCRRQPTTTRIGTPTATW